MLKVFLITIIILLIALAGMGIRMLLQRNGQFSGGSCQSIGPELQNEGISCACGSEEPCDSKQVLDEEEILEKKAK